MFNVPLHPGRLIFGAVILGVTGVALVPSGLFAGASGPTCMGIVIDYGTPSSSSAAMPPATATQAALVASGTSDEQALADVGDSIGTNSSGLICVINGYPANGVQNCTAASDNKFYFWSYWQGNPATNTWTYGNAGPASHTVNSGDTYVEGWRYQNPGPASAAASPPSVTPAAAFAQACPGVTPVADAGGGSDTATTNPSTGSTGGETSTTQTSTSVGSGTGAAGGVAAGGSASGQSAGRTSTTSVPPAGDSVTTTVAASSSPTTSTTSEAGSPGPGKSRRQLSAPPLVSRHHGGSTASGVLALVFAGLVVAALVAGAIFRWRRRPASE